MTGYLKKGSGARRDVPAGLFDAGMASLATFVTGLAAVNLLSETDRGVYGVFFAAFLAAGVVPQFLVFVPAEVIAVARPVKERLTDMLVSLKLGFGPSMVGAIIVAIAAVATLNDTTRDVTVALAVTAGIAVLVSPAQDHIRRSLHIARRSWNATAMSAIQLVTVLASVGTMLALDVPVAWVPFGALAIANIVTVSVGLYMTHVRHGNVSVRAVHLRELVLSGRWLLTSSLVSRVALFIGTVVIVRLVGADVMGYAEAARVAAQPVLVLGMGLGAVLGPRGMEAAIARDLPRARRAHHAYMFLIVGTGLAYLAIAGFAWVGNPMMYLVPAAYTVTGLTAVTIVSSIIDASSIQFTKELTGGRKEVELTKMSLFASPFHLVGAATAPLTLAFARPLGVIMSGLVRYGVFGIARRRMYNEAPDPAQLELSG